MRPACAILGPLLLSACEHRTAVGAPSSTTDAPAAPPAATSPGSPPDAASASSAPAPSSGLLHNEVQAEEIRCGKEPHQQCACAAPLGCGGGGKPCITLDK